MCILFVYIDNDATDGYQVIIANNRDEIYTRPTAPAAVWNDTDHCISGIDMSPGREGGTWFGMSTKGKIACLLSILSPGKWKKSKKGRGFLIRDYLKGSRNAVEFLKSVEPDNGEYNGYNLVLLEKVNNKWQVLYSTNKDQNVPLPIEKETFAISNSALETPWKKTTIGRDIFTAIIKRHNRLNDNNDSGDSSYYSESDGENCYTLLYDESHDRDEYLKSKTMITKLDFVPGRKAGVFISNKDKMVDELFKFLSDTTQHYPCEQLNKQAISLSERVKQERSQIFVHSPTINGGTMSSTIVLIDSYGRGEYIERHLLAPPTHEVHEPNSQRYLWSNYRFELDEQSKKSPQQC